MKILFTIICFLPTLVFSQSKSNVIRSEDLVLLKDEVDFNAQGPTNHRFEKELKFELKESKEVGLWDVKLDHYSETPTDYNWVVVNRKGQPIASGEATKIYQARVFNMETGRDDIIQIGAFYIDAIHFPKKELTVIITSSGSKPGMVKFRP